MGFVRTTRSLLLNTAMTSAVAASLGACVVGVDPPTPCAAIRLGPAVAGNTVVAPTAPIVAIAGGSEQIAGASPFVLHYSCPQDHSPVTDCELLRTPLDGLPGGNAVMISGTGRYVFAIERASSGGNDSLHTYRVSRVPFANGSHLESKEALLTDSDLSMPRRLLASLRNSDIVIARDGENRLSKFYGGAATLIASDYPNMELVAAGDAHIIGRLRHGNNDEELFLIPVDFEFAHQQRPISLLRGRAISAASFTVNDERLVLTQGANEDAETFIFDGSDGTLTLRFLGKAIGDPVEGNGVSGLRSTSPDGSHLAFRTARGSLALANLETGGACLVSSSSKLNELASAGFSAQGMLYFEKSPTAGKNRVMAWNPATRKVSALGETGYHLRAVPGQTRSDAPPWAIGTKDGSFAGLQADTKATALGLKTPLFLQRDDANLWVLNSVPTSGRTGHRLGLQQIQPGPATRSYSFDMSNVPTAKNAADMDAEPTALNETYQSSQLVCIATGNPGERAYRCANTGDTKFLSAAGSASEEGDRDTPRPEAPAPKSRSNCAPGVRDADDIACEYSNASCCYDSLTSACLAAGCFDNCQVNDGPSSRQVYCGAPAE